MINIFFDYSLEYVFQPYASLENHFYSQLNVIKIFVKSFYSLVLTFKVFPVYTSTVRLSICLRLIVKHVNNK